MFVCPMDRSSLVCGRLRCSGGNCPGWHGSAGLHRSVRCPRYWRGPTACSSAYALSGELRLRGDLGGRLIHDTQRGVARGASGAAARIQLLAGTCPMASRHGPPLALSGWAAAAWKRPGTPATGSSTTWRRRSSESTSRPNWRPHSPDDASTIHRNAIKRFQPLFLNP